MQIDKTNNTLKPCPTVEVMLMFEAACEKVEKQFNKRDDNAWFHDVGALRGYLWLFLEAYQTAMLPQAEPEGAV